MISALVINLLFFVVLFLGVKEQKCLLYICVEIILFFKAMVTLDFEL